MELATASEVISFSRKLEEEGALFYASLARKHPQNSETWLALAKENKKNIVQVERAYYGVITDAIEGCYSFGINPELYVFETEIPAKAKDTEIYQQALEIEKKVVRFYSDAAEQSKSLLADVPRVFNLIARKRQERISRLESIFHRGEP